VTVDFARVMEHIHDTSAHLAGEEGSDRARELGISVYHSFARFEDSNTLALDTGERIRAKRIVLATGGRPRVPAPLRSVRHLTNETVWALTDLPEHLVVVGGGPIGTELAQAFSRLGSRVTIITDVDRLIPGAHPDASQMIRDRLESEGVTVYANTTVVSAAEGESEIRLAIQNGTVVTASHVLVTTGRDASLEPLNPAAASIAMDASGAGLTHIASSQGAAVLVNLLSPRALAVDTGVTRWAIFTDPEVAQVGLTKQDALARGLNARVTRIPIDRVDRATVSGASAGFVEAVHTRTGKLLGVTIVGPNAVIAYEWAETVLRRGWLGRFARLSGRARLWLARNP
jgi:pyruvate/2-oxoglutarate dehydrogenase complex dihydrolipoamide dehydrogenase (E3) component